MDLNLILYSAHHSLQFFFHPYLKNLIFCLHLNSRVEQVISYVYYNERVVGAVSVSCPTVRGNMTRLLELKDRLLEACTRISADCGYYAAER